MKTITAFSFVLLVLSCASASADGVEFGSGANQFTMEFVPIGNPGNPADTTGIPNPAGSVGDTYNMGKYEVSQDMVIKANAAGSLGITFHGLSFVTGGSRPDMPVAGVSWNETARFVNWLNTSQGFQPAYKFATTPGDGGYSANANISLWTEGDAGYNSANPFRNSLAQYFLPSADEWYKAAYYDPNANGGVGGYLEFPCNARPTAVASGTASDTVVYGQSFAQGPADITQAGGLSPYGTMGQGGNVVEWEETEGDLVNDTSSSVRGFRGGNWSNHFALVMSSSARLDEVPTYESFNGFRVASVPEPSSLLCCVVVMLGLLRWKRS